MSVTHHQPPFKRRLCALLCLAAMAALPPALHAAESGAAAVQAGTRSIDIGPGPLSEVLARYAASAGVALSFDAASLRQVQSPGLKGNYTVQQGFDRLLAGSGLEAVQTSIGNFVLKKLPVAQGEATLTPMTVTASGLRDGTTEGSGSYTTRNMSTATKLPLSIRETPQSVTVMTTQRIEDQGLTSLSEVIQATPGLTVTKWGGERYRFTSRSFQVNNLMIDGVPIEYEEAALSTGAMSMYDRIEVMRGAAGMMEGAGTPGGSINLMRKRPTGEFQGSLTGSIGSWDNHLGSLDVGGPINEAKSLRGRAMISYQDKHSFIDDYKNKRTLAYGILEADLTPLTTATLGISYSKEDNPGVDWNGLGTYPDGSFLPLSRSTRMSPSWSYWDKKSTTVFADIEHRFDNGWKAKLAAISIDSKMDMKGTFLMDSSLDASGNPSFTLRGGAYDYDRTQRSLDFQTTGPFNLLGKSHDLLLGASYRRGKWRDQGGGATVNGSFDLTNFNPLAWAPGTVPLPTFGEYGLWEREVDVEQSSIYGMTRFALAKSLKAIIGGRLDWYENKQIQYDAGWAYGIANSEVVREFTPYAGIIYDLDARHSVYVSWTRIFNPQSYLTANGGLLDPQTGSNYEAGIKGEYFSGRLNARAAVFQIDLENLPDALPGSQCMTGLTSCYHSAGKVRSRGIEFELDGELIPEWQMAVSYTYASAKRLSDASDYDPIGSYSVGKRYATNIPRHLFKLVTTYRLPAEFNRWKIGATLHAQDRIESPWGVKQSGYGLLGLHAGYAVNKQLDLSLNVNNLFDRKYYSSIGSTTDANFFGEPRNFLLTARYKF